MLSTLTLHFDSSHFPQEETLQAIITTTTKWGLVSLGQMTDGRIYTFVLDLSPYREIIQIILRTLKMSLPSLTLSFEGCENPLYLGVITTGNSYTISRVQPFLLPPFSLKMEETGEGDLSYVIVNIVDTSSSAEAETSTAPIIPEKLCVRFTLDMHALSITSYSIPEQSLVQIVGFLSNYGDEQQPFFTLKYPIHTSFDDSLQTSFHTYKGTLCYLCLRYQAALDAPWSYIVLKKELIQEEKINIIL